MLPHAYPFEFVHGACSRPTPDSVLVRLSHGSGVLKGQRDLPSILGIEILAQAAAWIEADRESSGDEPPQAVYLAGCEARFSNALALRPMMAGDELRVTVEPAGSFGRLRRVAGRIVREGTVLVEAELMLGG